MPQTVFHGGGTPEKMATWLCETHQPLPYTQSHICLLFNYNSHSKCPVQEDIVSLQNASYKASWPRSNTHAVTRNQLLIYVN